MASTVSARPNASASWFARFKRQGYFFKYAAIATILVGVYLHVTRLFIGDDLLIRYVFTPRFDMLLALPMAYAGITGILSWRQVQFSGTAHKILYGLAVFYIAGSIPLHIATFFTQSTEFIRVFPMGFSLALLPWYALVIWFVANLRYKSSATDKE